MNRDKQIEEMARVWCPFPHRHDCDGCCKGCYEISKSEMLYNAGYRKASDIVDEIIKNLVDFADDNEKQMLVNGHSVWFINADDVTEFIAELKKKYTEDGK